MSDPLFKDPYPRLDIDRIVDGKVPRQLPCRRLVCLGPLVVVLYDVVDQCHTRRDIVPLIVIAVILERREVVNDREAHHQMLQKYIIVLIVDVVLDDDIREERLIDLTGISPPQQV